MKRFQNKHAYLLIMASLLAVLTTVLAGCGGGGGGGDTGGGPTAPAAFSLTSPSNTATAILSPTLSWTSASGAATYTVQVTTDPTFVAITTFQSTTIAAGTTSVVVSTLSPSTVYYWRVMAVNAGGTTPASPASRQFTTNKGASTSGSLVWAQTVDPSATQADVIYSVAVSTTTTALHAAGFDANTALGDYEWRMEKRRLDNGNLDTGFGTNGVVILNSSATTSVSDDVAYAVAIDSTYMYVVGYDSVPSDTNSEWQIEKRLLSTGAPVTAFGSSGIVRSNPSPGYDDAFAIAIDPANDVMYVAGYDSAGAGGSSEWRIEKRLLSTGTPTSFGMVNSHPSSTQDDAAMTIAIDSTSMYVGGYETNRDGLRQWRVEKRLLSTGAMVTAFGPLSDGVLSYPTSSVTSNDEVVTGIAVDASSLYIVGYVTDGSGLKAWKIEKRNKTNGALDTTFNAAGPVPGVIVSDPNPSGTDVAEAIAIDTANSAMYVAGSDELSDTTWEWRVEKRDLSTGAFVTSFGTNGVYTSHPSASVLGDDEAFTIAVDSTYIYVGGYDMVPGTAEWRIEKILK
jgi:hypothetical protein